MSRNQRLRGRFVKIFLEGHPQDPLSSLSNTHESHYNADVRGQITNQQYIGQCYSEVCVLAVGKRTPLTQWPAKPPPN